MADSVNSRELITDMLVSIDKGEEQSHILIKNVLDKYDYLEAHDKAFIKKVTSGTLERRITLDYIIDSVSNTPVAKMKPFIRNLIRMSTYQIFYMDKVPDSAACNEAVKIAGKRGFKNLTGFVNGVLRNISRNKDTITLPEESEGVLRYYHIRYSCPELLVKHFLNEYGKIEAKKILDSTLRKRNLFVRIREDISKEERESIKDEWHGSQVGFEKSIYLPYAYSLSNADNLASLKRFAEGLYTVQDLSSMMVAEIAGVGATDLVLDVCGAPGGKSLHAASKMKKAWKESGEAGPIGKVVCRDLSEYKVGLIRENIERMNMDNMETEALDARVFDPAYEEKADIVFMDVPCSGLGVIGKKPDIKYNATEESLEGILELQKEIIDTCVRYVKPGGKLIYSTCTLRRCENEEMAAYIMEKYGFEEMDISENLPENLHKDLVSKGMAELMPYDGMDGFFIAGLIKNGH